MLKLTQLQVVSLEKYCGRQLDTSRVHTEWGDLTVPMTLFPLIYLHRQQKEARDVLGKGRKNS